jgi:hypothetical protein
MGFDLLNPSLLFVMRRFRRRREQNLHFQAATGSISSRDVAAVELNRALGDRQT